ncbi:MAG: asparagine synthase-related protein, partial [Actinomadura sp.]
AAVRPFTRHDRPVRLALSGGRDSRLIAAALHAGGVPFVGATHGLAGHPDVLLAQRVAAKLGAECVFAEARRVEGAIKVRHPFGRAHEIVRVCEGMNSAYEGVNGWAPYDPEPRTSGSGGERLRGGFLTDQDDLSPDGLRRRLKTIFLAQDSLLTPDANAIARTRYDEWSARLETDGIDVLDKLHMFYRTGRWLAGSHTATLMNWAYYHPFLDNRVVRAALSLPVEWRRTEEPVALALRALAPQLRDIPLDGKRWRFELDRPRSLRELPGWRRRATPQVTVAGGFNWRRSYDQGFAEIMRDQILGAPAELFDIARREAVEAHLAELPARRPSQTWNLYTLSVLLSGAWREPAPDLPPVTVPMPG